MAILNKQSVREEFDKVKASFNEQVKSGKVPAETATLVSTLIMLFEIILSIFMEKSTKKTSANSSIPPSQTTVDETTDNSVTFRANLVQMSQANQVEMEAA